jgi:hypothetical protein
MMNRIAKSRLMAADFAQNSMQSISGHNDSRFSSRPPCETYEVDYLYDAIKRTAH